MTPQELKTSILQLAIQGKLVEQRPEEGTAEDLYREIQQEKQALINAGKIKKEKPMPEITEDEKPFDIPESWMWCYVGDLFQHNTGKALNGSDKSGTPMTYITTSNLYWDRFELEKLKEMPFTESEVEKCTVQKGDLLVCEGGDYGRSAIWPYDYPMRIQNHIHRLRAYGSVSVRYFYYCFYLYKNAGMIAGKGIAIQGLSANALHELKMPLPPLAEQKRIVAKIEELLPLIERYEQAWTRLEDFNKRFPGDMQKSILQMAIQGKLVEQCSEEGTGEELYKQIQTEKQALIKAGKIKKEKPLPEIAEDEIPFDVPESWKWVRLSAVTDMLSGFAFKSEDFKTEGKYRLLRGINLGVNDVRWKETVYVDTVSDRVRDYKLAPGDVLLGLDRPWISDGTRVAIFDEEEETYLVQRVLRIKGLGGLTSPFIALLLRSSLLKDPLGGETTGISVPHISPNQVGNIAIPLPPLAEQKRIVARLEELLPLCERLK
jgi:type I restriction enzyme S subunit